MRPKTTTTQLVIMALLVLYSPLFAQKKPADRKSGERQRIQEQPRVPSEEQVLHSLDEIISRGDNESTSFALVSFLANFSGYVDSVKTQKIANKIMNIPELKAFNEEYPKYAHETEAAKLRALGQMAEFSGVSEYILEALNSEIASIQTVAASILLSWSKWGIAAPVIYENEAYNFFQDYRDERAIPLLEEAVRSGSWQGRIFAAAALYYTYGDSTKYPQVALDIILNAPINTEDENTNRAKYLALSQVARFNLVEALPGLIRLAQDTAQGISPKAVGYLVDLGGMGYPEATQALIDIKEHHANANIREIAKNGLLKLEVVNKNRRSKGSSFRH